MTEPNQDQTSAPLEAATQPSTSPEAVTQPVVAQPVVPQPSPSVPQEAPSGVSPQPTPGLASQPGYAPPSGVPFVPPVPTAPVVPVAAPRRRGFVDAILVVAAVVAIGGIGFAAGRLTAPATTTGRAAGGLVGGGGFGNGVFPNGQGGTGQGGTGQGGLGGGFVGRGIGGGLAIQGEVTEATADHITLKLASGQTVQIPIDTATQYHQQTGASAGDVKTGSQVLVQLGQRATTGPGASAVPNGNGNRTLPSASSVTIVGQ